MPRHMSSSTSPREPVTSYKEASKKQLQNKHWKEKLEKASRELDSLIPPGDRLILVDQEQLGYKSRRTIPFVERDGQYSGLPPADATAIREFERFRITGASFLVFGWPAFWWLDYYQGLDRYRRSKFLCVLHNASLVVFDLRPSNRVF